LNSKIQKKNIHNGSQIVHKNVTNIMMKAVSELESRGIPQELSRKN
jgi:hypothetical protein